MTEVWVLTLWEFGGGGDDERIILGVYTTEDLAIEASHTHRYAEITKVEVDQSPVKHW
jgi:hypothetical protein